MISEQDIRQKYQTMRNMGYSDEAARSELGLQMSQAQAQAALAEAQQREAEHPKPAFSFDRYDDIDQRGMAVLERNMGRAASDQAEEQRLTAAITALDQQLLPIQQQRRALADQLARLRFQG